MKNLSKAFCFALPLLIAFSAIETASAQTNVLAPRVENAVRAANANNQNSASHDANQTSKTTVATNAVTVVNRAESDYLSGEASVSVNPKQPTVIRLGLAQNAVSVVEFPANDEIYYIHAGNPKLVAVFDSPTKETDRFVTLYPGEAFLPQATGQKQLSAAITMQMKSGLVIVLEVVPATNVAANAHRLVLSYNTPEVVATRRAAGLKTKLGEQTNQSPGKQTRAESRLINAEGVRSAALPEAGEAGQKESSTTFIEVADDKANNLTGNRRLRKTKSESDISRLAKKKFVQAVESSDETFTVWSKAKNGLSLSVAQTVEIDANQRLLLVAIKNQTANALRLLAEMPELQIQTLDGKSNNLQIERINAAHVETTAINNQIPAGATVYYALLYDAPVLGVNQKLRVLAAHEQAADAPAAISADDQSKKENR